LDEISIAVRHKGDESRGVRIAGADVAGGPGAPSTGLDTNKGKGKVAMAVRSDDAVSSDDDPAEEEKVAPQQWMPCQRPPSRMVTDPGGCLHAMSRLICSGLSRGGTRHAQRHRRGGDSFKGCCR
jgi:hypothetical protein